jgi:SsrA-binding protein
MAAKKNKAEKADKGPKLQMVSENRKARHEYEILDSIECGMQLMGSEVKTLRMGRLSLDEAYARVKNNELWLVGADIPPYSNAGLWNHEPKRPRKLLINRREFDKLALRAHERGLTLVPLRVYFTERGFAKCVVALAKGKKLHDKRETLKKRDADRGLSRMMRKR